MFFILFFNKTYYSIPLSSRSVQVAPPVAPMSPCCCGEYTVSVINGVSIRHLVFVSISFNCMVIFPMASVTPIFFKVWSLWHILSINTLSCCFASCSPFFVAFTKMSLSGEIYNTVKLTNTASMPSSFNMCLKKQIFSFSFVYYKIPCPILILGHTLCPCLYKE